MPSAKTQIDPPSDRDIVSTRSFDAPRAEVYAAFADPARVAQWWGPNGFTNTVKHFDLRVGGEWRIVMHAADGTNYDNLSRFTEVKPAERVVYQHIEPIHTFFMAMDFADAGTRTQLTWRMTFPTAEEADRLRGFIAPANEQNFDRLQAHLAKTI